MAPTARRPGPSIIIKLMLSVALVISLLTANLYLLLSPNYVAWQYGRRPLAAQRAAADKTAALGIVDYLLHRTDRLPILTHKERAHLADVRDLFDQAFVLFKAAVLILAILLLLLKRGATWGSVLTQTALVAAGGLACLTALLTLLLVNFDWVFVGFHRIFFAGSSWVFAGDSPLIQLFPFEFWARAGLHWILLTTAELAVLAALTAYAGRRLQY